MPLLLGFGGVVAVGALVLGWALFAPKGKPPAAKPSPEQARTPPPPPKAPPTAAEKAKAELEGKAGASGMSSTEYLDALVEQARRSPEKARSVWEEMRRLGQDDYASKVVVAGREAHPHDPWLNEKLGLRDRTKEIQAAADSEENQNLLEDYPDFQKVLEMRAAIREKTGAGWIDAATSDRLDALLKSCGERTAWMKDPVNERTHRLLSNLRGDPEFRGRSFEAVIARPATVFVERGEEAENAAALATGERVAKAFQAACAETHRFLKDEAGFPALKPLQERGDTRIRIVFFRTRRTFDQWHLDTGKDVPHRSVQAYYSPIVQMAFVHGGLDPKGETGIRGLSEETQVCLHEGFHQVYDAYQRILCDEAGQRLPEGYARLFDSWSVPEALFWYQEGLADYFGAARPSPAANRAWEPGQPDVLHLMTLARARASNMEWKIADFLFADQQEIYEKAEARQWLRGGADELKALMYAHGWAVTHYLLHGDKGKWRAAFLRYVHGEVRGDYVRAQSESLSKGFPELAADPALAAAVQALRKKGANLWQILEIEPGLGRFLRARPFLAAFGLPPSAKDPRVAAWMSEVDAGYRKHCLQLLADAGIGK